MDCEMGGRELKYSLLTAYFMVTNDKFENLGDLYLQVKPDDGGEYVLSGQGMAVNGINIQEHDKVAIPYKQAKPMLYDFLRKMAKGMHLVPVGHGVKGDIEHVLDKLLSRGSWEQHCSYHYIDTSVVLQYLRACGKMPYDTDGSVSALASHFNIDVDKNILHNAKYDTQLTAEVFQKMIELGK
jgi:hypothetical protein